MESELKAFSKTLRDFQQTLQTTKVGTASDFKCRDRSTPNKNIEDQYLSPELIYLYDNYETLLILPHVHLNSYSSLFPGEYSIDKGKTFQKYMPWRNGKVIFANSFNKSYEKLWVDPTQKNTPVYVTDINGNYKLIVPSLDMFFQLLIELCISYSENDHKKPKCNSSSEKWKEFREKIVSPYFSEKIKNLTNEDTNEIIIKILTLD